MMESILNTLDNWLHSWHIYIGKVTETIEERCANCGEHTEHNKQYQECFFTGRLSSCQLLGGLPISPLKFLQKALPGDLNSRVMRFPSSREAASKYCSKSR